LHPISRPQLRPPLFPYTTLFRSILPQSSLGKALNYFLNEYTALVGYLKSGLLEIDNNLIENSIRGPVVGRKRWLFIGHPDAGWRSEEHTSELQSLRHLVCRLLLE